VRNFILLASVIDFKLFQGKTMFKSLVFIILLVLLGGFSANAIAHPGSPHLHEGMQETVKMGNHKHSTDHCNLMDHSGKIFCPHKSQMRNTNRGIARDCGGLPAGRTLVLPGSQAIPLTETDQGLQDLPLSGDSFDTHLPLLPPCFSGSPEPPPKLY